ncbi:MAG: hypothetical protein ACT4O9_14180 [Blastocatellia bacterium]
MSRTEHPGSTGGEVVTAWSEMVPRDDDPQTLDVDGLDAGRRGRRLYHQPASDRNAGRRRD